jgi:hypothetical protein
MHIVEKMKECFADILFDKGMDSFDIDFMINWIEKKM